MNTKGIGMKMLALVGAVIGCALTVFASEVKTGDTEAQVRASLGEPLGSVRTGNLERLVYDRGTIELRDGIVVKADLLTAEQTAAQRVERERRLAEQGQQNREQTAQRLAAGNRVLADKLSDPAFTSLPASQQFDYWRDFHRQYPEVDIAAVLLSTLAGKEREAAVARQSGQIADVERRAAEAEASARAAQLAAEQAQASAPTYAYVPPDPAVTYVPQVVIDSPLCDFWPLFTPVVFDRFHGDRHFGSFESRRDHAGFGRSTGFVGHSHGGSGGISHAHMGGHGGRR